MLLTYKDRYINAETVEFMFCNSYNRYFIRSSLTFVKQIASLDRGHVKTIQFLVFPSSQHLVTWNIWSFLLANDTK
jgi:hypothetical protein